MIYSTFLYIVCLFDMHFNYLMKLYCNCVNILCITGNGGYILALLKSIIQAPNLNEKGESFC